MLILAELHDFRRFVSAPALMAYLGLVPGEDSSGEKHRRGRITRSGNALVRRLRVETVWHYQHRPSVGIALTRRRKGQPARVIASAEGAAAIVPARPQTGGGTQAGPEDRRGHRASPPASCGPRCNRVAPRRRRQREPDREAAHEIVMRFGDGPRRRRMI
jgi:hypothetical protein